MTGVTAFMLRRRALREQQVLRIVRGLSGSAQQQAQACDEIRKLGGNGGACSDLRYLSNCLKAVRHEIRDVDTEWLSPDEIRVLAWIALSQRKGLPAKGPIPDLIARGAYEQSAELLRATIRAAETLNALGIRLPSLALSNDVIFQQRN